jgi:tetratricopeptide (TPR) repeat protein
MIKYLVTPLLVVASLPFAAVANPVDNYAARDITKARYAVAIQKLERDYARSPNDESTLLNLALAYRYAGREAEAAPLYRKVLAMPDYELDTTSGVPVYAHRAARAALARSVQLTAR